MMLLMISFWFLFKGRLMFVFLSEVWHIETGVLCCEREGGDKTSNFDGRLWLARIIGDFPFYLMFLFPPFKYFSTWLIAM